MIAGNPIMAGGKKPSGSVNINANGTFDVTEKASAVVNVPNPSSGSLAITANGTYDVTEKASAVVNVPNPSSGSLAITANGTYDVTEKASAVVNVVSAPVLLWTNPSPNDPFPEQTVSFGSSYDGFLIETTQTFGSTTIYGISFVNAGEANISIGAANMIGPNPYVWLRQITAVNPNSIVFSGGCWGINKAYVTDGQYARPTRIWGVNFRLV